MIAPSKQTNLWLLQDCIIQKRNKNKNTLLPLVSEKIDALNVKVEEVQRRATRWILSLKPGEKLLASDMLPLVYNRAIEDLVFFYKAFYSYIDIDIDIITIIHIHSVASLQALIIQYGLQDLHFTSFILILLLSVL